MFTNDTTPAAQQQCRLRFAAGDPAAIRAAYRTYGQSVYAVAYRVLGDVALTEDAVQQTFV
jgi:DNA-directed RNA polymerase specialized sigma24 family protein